MKYIKRIEMKDTLTGYGCAFGGGTVINAIASWYGCAFGIDLKTYAKVTIDLSNKTTRNDRVLGKIRSISSTFSKFNGSSKSITVTDTQLPEITDTKSQEISDVQLPEISDTSLIENCVLKVLNHFDFPYFATVETRSEIPVASGLKSSTAAAHAAILATLDAINETLSEE
ncbi:MAG: hypothetical protein GX362_02000 [Methanosarcinaceae archaeon]|nr:hypothetical protein [Methanosarcinaceae archaeon]